MSFADFQANLIKKQSNFSEFNKNVAASNSNTEGVTDIITRDTYEDGTVYGDMINNINREHVIKNGINAIYISVETNGLDDEISGDPTNKFATGVFKVKFLLESIPTTSIVKTLTEEISMLGSFMMVSHKGLFKDITSAKIEELKKENLYWNARTTEYKPKPNDIIILEDFYDRIFEVTGVNDNSDPQFSQFFRQDYDILKVKNWTKQPIDFHLVKSELENLNVVEELKTFIEEDGVLKPTATFAVNDKIKTNEMSRPNVNKLGDNLFGQVFGDD